jgi:hypothetical protein
MRKIRRRAAWIQMWHAVEGRGEFSLEQIRAEVELLEGDVQELREQVRIAQRATVDTEAAR